MQGYYKRKMVIISPSGNLYGSERVLLDFLKNTSFIYEVYLPKNSIFLNELTRHSLLHKVKSYNLKLIPILYFSLFFKIFFNKIKGIYINEGGHIRYIKLLAKCFKKIKFFVHIRILEDTNQQRLSKLSNNITLLSVSNYISDNLKAYPNKVTIYDPFDRSHNIQLHKSNATPNSFSISIIGRITKTKGIEDAFKFFEVLDQLPNQHINYTINFYGILEESIEVTSFVKQVKDLKNLRIEFRGFVKDQTEIYKNTNCVIHFNPNESLGRIFFEAINFGIPFLGFKEGGIGEIAKQLKLEEYVVAKNNNWIPNLIAILSIVISNPEKVNLDLMQASELMALNFSTKNYVSQIEKLIC